MAYPDILVRYQLVDLWVAIFIPGTIASAAPVQFLEYARLRT